MPENTHMAENRSLEMCSEDDAVIKKKNSKKLKTKMMAKEGPQDLFSMLDSLSEEKQQEIQKALHLFSLGQGPPRSLKEAIKHKYLFWDTQPVSKIGEEVVSQGPIQEKINIPKQCYSLPDGFCWDTLDLENPMQLAEVCTLLNDNYTQDDDNTLRFHYSSEFLHWALCPPDWQAEWHCGVRVKSNKKLVGFISAIPVMIQIYDIQRKMVEVNFLCVHKKLRCKRMAPVLIREITRRVHLHGLSTAVYSTSAVLPTPVVSCRYWHRSLNPRKLIELNFSSLPRNMTLQRALKLNRLPEITRTTGLRPISQSDLSEVQTLLRVYLKNFHLFPIMNEKELLHWFLTQDGVVETFVVESTGGVITDMVSFYTLTSTVLNHQVHRNLKAAYLFYAVTTVTPLQQLMEDVLIMAKARGFDVFTALDVMDNKRFLEPLKFTEGDTCMHYYLYNWKSPLITPDKVGLYVK